MAKAESISAQDQAMCDKIKDLVLFQFDVEEADFFGKCRKTEYVKARQLFIYLCVSLEVLKTKYNTIAYYLDCDHSTAIHNYRVAHERIAQDRRFEAIAEESIQLLEQNTAYDETTVIATISEAKTIIRRMRKEMKMQADKIAEQTLSLAAYKKAVATMREKMQNKPKPLPLF